MCVCTVPLLYYLQVHVPWLLICYLCKVFENKNVSCVFFYMEIVYYWRAKTVESHTKNLQQNQYLEIRDFQKLRYREAY